jgi:hypothetical protein
MSTPSPLPALLAGALVGLAGCQALDTKYEEASLDEVLKGQVVSSTGRFRIPRPAVPVARRNTGIVREGSMFVVIVGPGLKSTVNTYTAEGTEYGVRLMREPHAYLVLERVWTGDEEIDLFEGVDRLRFDFPDLAQQSEIPVESYSAYSAAQPLPENGSLHLDGFIASRREIAPELRATLHPDLRGSAGARRYYLQSGGMEVLVANLDPTTQLILDFLILEKKPFDGGVRIAQKLDPRTAEDVAAAVDVRWILLGGGLCFRAPNAGPAAPAPPTT